ncbi:hypothetical protein CXF59_09495 [Flavobacterium sp. ALD4]|uniref:hypothetical protein n=1 Tax=Flavobacterium sp. ALD4 TaxID=2058314 RepID=UPI000C34E1A0|nr:hypothetical protein [Flavobacterium sp. ALD4]PKH66211.1 hypothetical protein CXF59_09495 [Flavobacterium sp. ALD4]
MKKYFYFLIVGTLLSNCQVSETIYLNEDGSGKIEVVELRDEHSYMQIAGANYSKEEKYVDTSYAFSDVVLKYNDTFLKFTKPEQELFTKYNGVNLHVKKSSYDKEFRTVITQSFNNIETVPDLYKTEDYADDLENNYALTAEKHYYKVSYGFDGTVFKRIVKIIDVEGLEKASGRIDTLKTQVSKFNVVQTYTLNYHFPRKIKSVSNTDAKISTDKKSLSLQLLLTDTMQNPESTSLEVVLENDL